MLTSLHIQNFALIDRLSIDFTGGFSIITGETGAGKSILLGALGLALGKRADTTSLRDASAKCVIEAHFSIADYNLQPLFEEAGLDYDPNTIIRREILPGGKSRAFVNDTPANLQSLAELSSNLIDIHSQHEMRSLSDSAFQFRVLDALAGNFQILEAYRQKLAQYKGFLAEKEDLTARLAEAARESDYREFLLAELTDANLDGIDLEELEGEASVLENMSSILEQMERGRLLAEDEQAGFMAPLAEFRQVLSKLAAYSKAYSEFSQRADAAHIELQDLVSELLRQASSLSVDPLRLEQINMQLQAVYNLQKKHQATAVSQLVEIRENLSRQADLDAGLEERIGQIDTQLAALEDELAGLAQKITSSRIQAAPELASKIELTLHSVGMPHARFQAAVSPAGKFLHNGSDKIEFLFAGNKGSEFAPMKKVASGGELSRIMLAIKSLLAGYAKLPTIIFDEIDTGVSGEIADAMGNIMERMSATMQVFAITHLPQIAAKGSHHYKVFKQVVEGTTHSRISLIQGDDRVREIAQMLSGSQVSESAINHARALLD